MDEADRGNEAAELFLNSCLAKKRETLTAFGHCFYCSEALAKNVLFCGFECRDDYEQEQKMLRMSGRR